MQKWFLAASMQARAPDFRVDHAQVVRPGSDSERLRLAESGIGPVIARPGRQVTGLQPLRSRPWRRLGAGSSGRANHFCMIDWPGDHV
jgi:hypothetical protein